MSLRHKHHATCYQLNWSFQRPDATSNGGNVTDWQVYPSEPCNGSPASAPVSSPDDWIEIGSPLGVEAPPKLVLAGRGRCNSFGDGSQSSGGSVDECFDFGMNGCSGGRSAAVQEKPAVRCDAAKEVVTWTDIDELDWSDALMVNWPLDSLHCAQFSCRSSHIIKCVAARCVIDRLVDIRRFSEICSEIFRKSNETVS